MNIAQSSVLGNATILITGATGFIGGRLVEYLVPHCKAQVRALVRNYGRAVRLARWPIDLVPGDLMDPDSLHKAVANCDLVFHCAYGSTGDAATQRAVTVDGTRNLMEASLIAKVKRVIHVSTIAVHGPDPGLTVDENTPLRYSDDVYADAKLDAEETVRQYAQDRGLPVVIVRPTIVYGPRAGGWTVGPVNRIKRGKQSLIEGGSGIANHVYVDDVVQALLLSAIQPEAVGEAFIVSHGTGVTWKEFFGHYARALDVELPELTLQDISEQRQKLKQLQNPVNMGLTFVASPHAQSVVRSMPAIGPVVGLARRAVPRRARQAILSRATMLREAKLNPPAPPRQWMVDLFCARGICKIDRAQRLLGYQPRFSLQEGMELTEAWLRYAKLI
jgi:nucleoside-diphosphate-sugar epimerase